MKSMRFAVVGAGSGGVLMTVQLKQMGHSVKLMDKNESLVKAIQAKGSVKASGKTEGEVVPDAITTCVKTCIEGVDVIMVCTTTDAHGEIATQAAASLRDGQIVVLNPGHLGGSLNFANALKNAGCTAKILLAEASDLMYACRTVEPGHTLHTGVKAKVQLGSVPARDAQAVIDVLGPVFPCFLPAKSILHSSLSGAGALLHSIPCILNMNKIELKQNFDYYMEGLTPNICNVIEAADKERMALCAALGIEAHSLLDHLKAVYGLKPDTLYDAIQSCEPYQGLQSPKDVTHRFVQEDTLSDLAPTASLGAMLGVSMPVYQAAVTLASALLGRDYAREGRNVESLGISGMTAEQLMKLVS